MSDHLAGAGPMVALAAVTGAEPDEFAVFMGRLVEEQRRQYAFTTSSLIDSLAWECAESAARLQLIGEAVGRLLDSPYTPSAFAVENCLFPYPDDVAARRDEILVARGVHSSTVNRGDQ